MDSDNNFMEKILDKMLKGIIVLKEYSFNTFDNTTKRRFLTLMLHEFVIN